MPDIVLFSYNELMKNFFRSHISDIIRYAGAGNIWLLILFIVQAIYIILYIFLPLPDGHEKSVLDVVTRTAAAVLVGYFLSKNFAADQPETVTLDQSSRRKTLQINIAGIIGLCSLSIVMTVRYVDSVTLPYNVISQIRDFYLASVAFLMGTSK